MMMNRKNGSARCLNEADIARFVDKTLPADRRRAAIAHLADCARCRAASIEVARLAAITGQRVPSDLAERAFAAARASRRRSIPVRFALPLAVAAMVFAVSLIAITMSGDAPRAGADLANIAPVLTIGADDAPATARVASRRADAVPSAVPDAPRVAPPQRRIVRAAEKDLLHAGWCFFQLSSTRTGNEKLFATLSRNLTNADIDRREGVDLVITQQYPEFLERLARLPQEEQKEFIEGYVLSMLYYSDSKGTLKRDCMERSRDILADASGAELREAMLYNPECALPGR